MSENYLAPWVAGALYARHQSKWIPQNPAAEMFGDLNSEGWGGWDVLKQNPAGICSIWLVHTDQGQLRAEIMPGDTPYLRILEPQAESTYLVARDNLLNMIQNEFQVPLESLSKNLAALKTPTDLADWGKKVSAAMESSSRMFRLLPSFIDLAKVHGHASLDADERIELSELIPRHMREFEAAALSRGIKLEFSPGEKPLGALYGSEYWLSQAIRCLLNDVLDNAEENTDVRLVARQMPYMLNLMIRVVGGIGQRGMTKELQDERPLIPSGGKVDAKRVELHLAYAVLKRLGGNFKLKSGGLGVEYIIEIPTGQGRSADTQAKAKLAAQQAEQYAKDMAMLMEAVARRSK